MLERLPYYGVFDFMAFSVDRRIEELPASSNDDRIRWATFHGCYPDDFLSRYAPGGATEVFREILDETRCPGMQPVGHYPIQSRNCVRAK